MTFVTFFLFLSVCVFFFFFKKNLSRVLSRFFLLLFLFHNKIVYFNRNNLLEYFIKIYSLVGKTILPRNNIHRKVRIYSCMFSRFFFFFNTFIYTFDAFYRQNIELLRAKRQFLRNIITFLEFNF